MKKGADLNKVNNDHLTALNIVIQFNNLDLVVLLLDNGTQICLGEKNISNILFTKVL